MILSAADDALAGPATANFSAEDCRLMARTFRLRAADETSMDEIRRLVALAQRYESAAKALLGAGRPRR